MPSLFISYTSHDRPWAERLYNDLRQYYPTFDIFWDRVSIPQGHDYRAILNPAAKDTHHFVVLWSEKAKASNEVMPEVESFRQNKGTDSKRTLFYIPLEGEYGPLGSNQALTDLRDQHKAYDPAAPDLGLSKLANEPVRKSWNRIIQTIGDTMMNAIPVQLVTLAIVALNDTQVGKLDQNLNDKSALEPSLQELLNGIDLTLPQAKARYGATAFEWKPYGTPKTVIDILQEIRMETNSKLSTEYWFEWKPLDLILEVKNAATQGQLDNIFLGLSAGPSIVVVDPISLYHSAGSYVFDRLSNYARKQQSLIVSLAPAENVSTDFVFRSLRVKGGLVLENYFQPPVPFIEPLGECGVNVRHNMELERLVRCSLSKHYSQRSVAGFRAATNMVPSS
jgi:hypothetical protein